VGGMPRSYLAGLGLANNATDPSNDIDIADGAARADDDAADLVLASPLTKRLDAGWTAGSGQGGLDTGSKAANAWYHVWLIKRSDTGAVDALFSTSATTPVMPSNYDKKRRIGAVKTDGSGNLFGFVQTGDHFLWANSVADHTGTTVSGANVALSLSVPVGLKVVAQFHARATSTGGETIELYTPGQSVLSTTSNVWTISANISTYVSGLLTNLSGEIYAREDGSSVGTIIIETHGWLDRRGRDD